MRISELIQDLTRMQSVYGDIDCRIELNEFQGPVRFTWYDRVLGCVNIRPWPVTIGRSMPTTGSGIVGSGCVMSGFIPGFYSPSQMVSGLISSGQISS